MEKKTGAIRAIISASSQESYLKMSDFILKLKNNDKCNSTKISSANSMQYYDDIKVCEIKNEICNIIISRADDWAIWGPYESGDGSVSVSMAGRIALDGKDWESASELQGSGGLACKAIYRRYRDGGLKALEELNGSFAVLVHDKHVGKLYIINDRCGMYPCYMSQAKNQGWIIGSHPDLVAVENGNASKWDLVSLTEYLVTGKVSYPNTYYENVKAIDYGTIHTFNVQREKVSYEGGRKYFNFQFKLDHGASELELAQELASAIRKSINRRTMSIFGRTGISLSGGLDSRALLCAAGDNSSICTFCFYDEENREYRIARDIARAAGVEFIPLRRSFEHYGSNAEMGVRISGAMGDFGNNHYLGFRDTFRNLGIDNIIAGFYCDYLFKSLVLNKKRNRILRTENFASFRYENYMPFFWFDTEYSKQVKERQDKLLPDFIKKDESDYGRLEIERRRLFPLYTEPDNMETLIPQRVMGWYLPIVDNDIIETYLKIPPAYKLNTSMYSKTVRLLCGERISKIENINTGARVDAGRRSVMVHELLKSVRTTINKKKKSIATDESWPNWYFYIQNSKTIKDLWLGENDRAQKLFTRLIGHNPYQRSILEHTGKRNIKLFLRLLTIKMWLKQRT